MWNSDDESEVIDAIVSFCFFVDNEKSFVSLYLIW
jgi:hypothetical protein